MPYKDPEKQRAYQREFVRKRRKEWLDLNGPCQKCGTDKNLEVDHRNRRNKVEHRIWSWTKKRRDKELSKCRVLCRTCHKRKTYAERGQGKPMPHGTNSRYTSKRAPCRCERCRRAHARAEAARRERKRRRESGGGAAN